MTTLTYRQAHLPGNLQRAIIATISVGLLLGATVRPASNHMIRIEQSEFGKTREGRVVHQFILRNSHGMVVKIMTYGGIISELRVPDRSGAVQNVVLGFEVLEPYLLGHPHFGAITGRVANRVARARFDLDGKHYSLAANNGANHLHGGSKGFDKKVWTPEVVRPSQDEAGVQLRYISPDGEEGYPGNLEVTVTYILTEENELKIRYQAKTDQATPVNLTNHSYFNLAGGGTILDHQITIPADRYTPTDDELLPTGEIADVTGTALDFRSPTAMGKRFGALKKLPIGYDDNFVLNKPARELGLAARVTEPASGRVMEVLTTEPAVQLYTGNFLDGKLTGTGGQNYAKHTGFCLETQHYPDSLHHTNFPSIILRPGNHLDSTTVFRFTTANR